jgi:peptidoglycan/xylan/chitin deacetylase (PgdA/CDA1 family)
LNPTSLTLLTAVALVAAACGARAAEPPSSPTGFATEQLLPATVAPVAATPTVAPSPAVAPTQTPAPLSLPAGEVARARTGRAEMALTFDCGASGAPTPAILSALRDAHVRVTFFITGQWATTNPDLTRQIAADHEIANHSWSHRDFSQLSDQEIRTEMERTESAIGYIAGVSTKPFWRAPFGSRDARILSAVREGGWPYHIYWSADSGDWQDIPPSQVRTNVTRAAGNGAIVVQHCGSVQTATVLPDILRDLANLGLRVVTLSELLRD